MAKKKNHFTDTLSKKKKSQVLKEKIYISWHLLKIPLMVTLLGFMCCVRSIGSVRMVNKTGLEQDAQISTYGYDSQVSTNF